MKPFSEMTQPEIGAYVVTKLKESGFLVVLSGGAVVSIYSLGRYVSKDLDLIDIYPSRKIKLKEVMQAIGFIEEAKYYRHPDSKYFVEILPGPLGIGEELNVKTVEKKYSTGTLVLITPTECIKDRLAAYYHWGDLQSLEQAVLVAGYQKINLEEVRRWSKKEGKLRDFENIFSRLTSKAIK
jgi:hypothetical protein